jgi:hypothetical protein
MRDVRQLQIQLLLVHERLKVRVVVS